MVQTSGPLSPPGIYSQAWHLFTVRPGRTGTLRRPLHNSQESRKPRDKRKRQGRRAGAGRGRAWKSWEQAARCSHCPRELVPCGCRARQRLAAAKHRRTDVAPQPSSHGQFREEELDGPFRVTGTGPIETTKTMLEHRIQLENSMKLINISSTGQIWAPAVACRSGVGSNSKVSQSSGSFYILSGQFASLPCKGLAKLHACSKAAFRGGSDNEEQGGF